ncbi:MAG: hypothetical protein HQK69_05530 [Desulfamplus sp.]|nr:hypothetical protein [Desulfamplus sp.]
MLQDKRTHWKKMTTIKHISDIRGIGKLATEAVSGITSLVEDLHQTILSLNGILDSPYKEHTTGITGMVYHNIRTVTELVGNEMDVALNKIIAMIESNSSNPLSPPISIPLYEAFISALNGIIGDHLAASENPLAINMQFRQNGVTLPIDNESFSDGDLFLNQLIESNGKIALMVHGLCMNDLQWNRDGHDHGAELSRDFGYTPLYLHYNTGLHISENGKAFSELMEKFINQISNSIMDKPVEIVIIAHSMGGLVSRSAFHYGKLANHTWLKYVKKLICLGTPHHGSPLERFGNWIDMFLSINPYSAPFSRLGKIRSAGVTDLRYGNILEDDWKEQGRFEYSTDSRIPVSLPENIDCYAVAVTTIKDSCTIGKNLVGDGLVPLNSALGSHANPDFNLLFPDNHKWVGNNMNHMDLLNNHEVYQTIKKWVAIND